MPSHSSAGASVTMPPLGFRLPRNVFPLIDCREVHGVSASNVSEGAGAVITDKMCPPTMYSMVSTPSPGFTNPRWIRSTRVMALRIGGADGAVASASSAPFLLPAFPATSAGAAAALRLCSALVAAAARAANKHLNN